MRKHVLLALLLTSVAVAQSFDKPLKKQVVDLGPVPDLAMTPQPHVELTCFYFPEFVVKQEYTETSKGSDRVTVEPIRDGVTPACSRSHAAGVDVVEKPEWGGWFFWGVKGNAVFFIAPDGTNGAIPFLIFDARNWNKLFEDSSYDSSVSNRHVEPSPFDRLRVNITPDGNVRLTYLRGGEANCELPSKGEMCWQRIRKKFNLVTTAMPKCTGYRELPQQYRPWVSAIVYPVEVTLFPQPVTKTIAGPVKCWPVD
jgi:hypothetical protein